MCVAACFDSGVVKTEGQAFDLSVCWQRAERGWSPALMK